MQTVTRAPSEAAGAAASARQSAAAKAGGAKAEWVYRLLCLIGVVVIGNLNGILMGLFGIGQAVSPLLGLLCGGVLWLSWSRQAGSMSLSLFAFALFFVCYFGFGLVGAINSDFSMVMGRLQEIGVGLILVAAVYRGATYVARVGWFDRLLASVLWITVVAASLVGIFRYGMNDFFLYDSIDYDGLIRERSAGVFANANEAGMIAGLGLTIALSGVVRGGTAVVMGCICMVTAFMVYSRGGIAGCLAVAFAISVLRVRSGGGKLAAVLVFALLLITQFLLADMIAESGLLTRDQSWRITSLADFARGRTDVAGIDSGRIGLIGESLQAIQKSPLLGYGIGQSFKALQGSGSHNQFLSIAIETGVPVALLLVCFHVIMLWEALRIGCSRWRLFGFGFAVWFLIMTPFCHNLYDLRFISYFLALGLAAIGLSGMRVRRGTGAGGKSAPESLNGVESGVGVAAVVGDSRAGSMWAGGTRLADVPPIKLG